MMIVVSDHGQVERRKSVSVWTLAMVLSKVSFDAVKSSVLR